VSDATVSRLERGHFDTLSVRAIRAIAAVLEIRIDLLPRWRGGDLDRMVNARHARVADDVVRRLQTTPGWICRPEVSFAIYGERGVVDILAWHAEQRALLVVELKTEVVDVGEILGTLDRKARLARGVAADLGWEVEVVSVALLVGEGHTNRRRVEAHKAVFGAALPDDGRRLRGWLRAPIGRIAALTFVPDRHPGSVRTGLATVRRVRTSNGPDPKTKSRSG